MVPELLYWLVRSQQCMNKYSRQISTSACAMDIAIRFHMDTMTDTCTNEKHCHAVVGL